VLLAADTDTHTHTHTAAAGAAAAGAEAAVPVVVHCKSVNPAQGRLLEYSLRVDRPDAIEFAPKRAIGLDTDDEDEGGREDQATTTTAAAAAAKRMLSQPRSFAPASTAAFMHRLLHVMYGDSEVDMQ
jgi:hypothetical protein